MATTINSYAVQLTLDAGRYIKNSKLSRTETAALSREINAARTPQETFNRSYDRLENALQKGAISLDVYQRLIGKAREKLAAATPQVESLSQAFARQNKEIAKANQLYREQSSVKASAGLSRYASSLNTASSSLVTFGTRFLGPLAAVTALRSAVSQSFDVSRARASLEVLMGSAAAAEQQLQDLRAIDASSPLTFTAGLQATRTLLSFGIAAEDVTSTLRMLGDVTGADNERFKSMALAFAQVSAAGRLQGQDLRQMIDAGFNPLQEISRKTGESLVILKKRMEDGAISSREVAEAFRSATSEGGRFFGMMDKQGATAAGKWGQMMSKLQQLAVSVGDSLGPLIVQLADFAQGFIEMMKPVIFLLEKMGSGLGFLTAVVNDFFGVFGKAARGELRSLSEAFEFERSNKILESMSKVATSAENAATSGNKVIDGINGIALAAENAASSQDKVTAAVIRTAKAAEEASARRRKLQEEYDSMAEGNLTAFENDIRDKQNTLLESRFGEGNMEEIEAIRKIIDMSDATQRAFAKTFEENLQKGRMTSDKSLKFVFDDAQEAQLKQFRELQRQTQEIERQERLKREGDKLRETALKNAQKHFEEQRKAQMKMRQDMTSLMSGAGAEIGSEDSIRFNAQFENDRIAATLTEPQSLPTDEEILTEARKQLTMLESQDRKQAEMSTTLKMMLTELKQNGFKRIR